MVYGKGQEHWGAVTSQAIQLFHCKHIATGKAWGFFPEPAVLSCCCNGSLHGAGRAASARAATGRGRRWLDRCRHTLLSCDSICSAFRARKGHGCCVLACSEQQRAFWGVRRRTSEMRQGEKGSQTERQGEQR